MDRNDLDSLRGLRILLAEDDCFLAELLRQLLVDMGCTVVGPFGDLDEVLDAIGLRDIDAALLDVQLGNDSVHAAADELTLQGIPFILQTGHNGRAGPFAPPVAIPLLTKPFDVHLLEDAMRGLFPASNT